MKMKDHYIELGVCMHDDQPTAREDMISESHCSLMSCFECTALC